MAAKTKDSAEVIKPTYIVDEDTLRTFESWDDVASFFGESPVIAGDIIGDGYTLLQKTDEKNELVDKDMLIVKWKWNESDYGTDEKYILVWALVRQRNGGVWKVKFIDGGVGIRQGIADIETKGFVGNVLVVGGLVRSDYTYEDDKGNEIPATTFYLSTNVPA